MLLKRTALYEEHKKQGARLVDFGGWELPVQYTGVLSEHEACRRDAGLFDVSHMGEIEVQGLKAAEFLDYLVTNRVSRLSLGQAQYTVMCHHHGGIVDDLVIYRKKIDSFLVVVNASNTKKDFEHFLKIKEEFLGLLNEKDSKNEPLLSLQDRSSSYTQIALQGPKAQLILSKLTTLPLSEIKTYWFQEGMLTSDKIPALIARTGYTGEDGFELYVNWEAGPKLWQALLEVGAPHGLLPCGLGARDTLRLEMKYPLYGNELSDQTHPLEAGLSWVVKFDKKDFVGKEALLAIRESASERGVKRKLVGFQVLGRQIPRAGYLLYDEGGVHSIGQVTSGTQSPSLKLPLGIGYVDSSHARPGCLMKIDVRGTKIEAQVVETPFYKKNAKEDQS